jgi:hypothetical protein
MTKTPRFRKYDRHNTGGAHYDLSLIVRKEDLEALQWPGVKPECGVIFNLIRGRVVSADAVGRTDIDWLFTGGLYEYLLSNAEVEAKRYSDSGGDQGIRA